MITLMLVVVCTLLVLWFTLYHEPREQPIKRSDPTKGLSDAAKQLVKEYNALPADSRPFPDIIPMVRALDVRYQPVASQRNVHFAIGLSFAPVRWSLDHCDHRTPHCPYKEYYKLHEAIEGVKSALSEREKAMARAATETDMDMLNDLMSRLRTEAQIQRGVTREIA